MEEAKPVPILPRPGVVKTETDRIIEGRYKHTEKMRFVGGLPEKIGGFEKKTTDPASGKGRVLHAWRDNKSQRFISTATYRKVYIYGSDFAQHDVTPLAGSGSLGTDPFTTESGSDVVVVEDEDHGRSVGDTVTFAGASTVNGLTLNGTFLVTTVLGVDEYEIVASGNASGTGAGGGASVTYSYEISSGAEYGALGFGWGVGPWGIDTWGDARPASTISIEPRIWSLDNYGEDLYGAFNGGSIYWWDATNASSWPRMTKLTNAPDDVRYMFVTGERFIMALRENMKVSWPDQTDPTVWTPSDLNTANERTLGIGTKLVGGAVLGPRVNIVLSDAAAYILQYTGSKFVHDSRLIGRDCGLIAPGALKTVSGIAYWMGHDTFWLYDGSVKPIPNVEDIKDYVFDALRTDRSYQCAAVYFPRFSEIWWLYTTTDLDDPGLYVIYSLSQQCWAVGTLERTAGRHFEHGDTRPLMVGVDGHIYQHEEGFDADGIAMRAELELAPYAIEEGRQLMNIEGFVPDIHEQSGDLELTLEGWDRLRDSSTIDSVTKTIEEDTEILDMHMSGRYIGLSLVSDTLGGNFRMGKPVAQVKSAGVRR